MRRNIILLLSLLVLLGLGFYFFWIKKASANEGLLEWAIEPQFASIANCGEGACVATDETQGFKLMVVDYSGNLLFFLKARKPASEGKGGLYWAGYRHRFYHNLLIVKEYLSSGLYHTYFVDKKGKIKIDRHFEGGYSFSEGLAAVQREMLWGFIDTSGDYQIQPTFWGAKPFSQGLAALAVISEDFYNKKKLDENSTNEEMSLDRSNALRLKWGLINKAGEWVVAPQFDDIQLFNEGLAWAEMNKKWGVIDTAGNWRMKPHLERYPENNFRDGLSLWNSDIFAKFIYFMNANGDTLFANRFIEARSFSEGLAAVQSPFNKKWGYINNQGEAVIPFVFTEAKDFSQGLAAAQQDSSLYGYINRKGEWAQPCLYEKAENFNEEGYAPAMKDGKWGLLRVKNLK